MSASVRITKSLLEHERVAVVASGKVRFIWDSEVKGFGARVQPRAIAFVLDYRHGCFHRRMTFGRLGELRTVEEARRKAAEIKLAVRAGRDPLEEVRAKRKVAERGVTLCAVVEKWMAASRAGWSGDTARLYASTLRKDVLPRFGEREVESITRAEWSDLLTGVRTRAPATATLLRRIIGSVLSWAVDAELLSAVNLPSAKRTAPKVAPRDRVVTDDEIGIIWAATPALEPRQQAFARFVMLTVVRSGAAALAHRDWIYGRSIRFPGSTLGLKRKADRRDQDHRVALSEWAWDQIAPVIEDESRLLFSEGQAPIRPARVLAALRAESGISDWEWHDFRRSFRSWAAKSVVQADAAETVLGHTIHRDEVAKAYQRHKFEDEAEVAFHRWQAHIQQLTGGEDAGNILPMRLPNKK